MGRPGTAMMTRRAVHLTLAILATAASALASQTIFSYLRAVPQNDDIVVQWRSMNEAGVQYYDVERSSDELPEFRRLERLNAKGGGTTYSFTDNGAFYKPTSGKRFTYRIRAIGATIEQYSASTTVVHEVSSVKRSWGMIKELFR
jgi:hypothetical protein